MISREQMPLVRGDSNSENFQLAVLTNVKLKKRQMKSFKTV